MRKRNTHSPNGGPDIAVLDALHSGMCAEHESGLPHIWGVTGRHVCIMREEFPHRMYWTWGTHSLS